MKKPYFKLSPELADGEHWIIGGDLTETGMESTLEAVRAWLDACVENGPPGESITIGVVELTDDEVAALPDI